MCEVRRDSLMLWDGRAETIALVKRVINDAASAYAAQRVAEEERAKERGIPNADVKATLFNHPDRICALFGAHSLFVLGDDNLFRYFGRPVGSDEKRIYRDIESLLEHYDPKVSLFTTYLENKAKWMEIDYYEAKKKAPKAVSIEHADGKPRADAPLTVPLMNEEVMESVEKFGMVAKVLGEQKQVVAGMQQKQTRIERFCAYYTRKVVLTAEMLFDYVGFIDDLVDRALSQPYILYMKEGKIENDAQAKAAIRNAGGKYASVKAVALVKLVYHNRLIEARYREKSAMNAYYQKTNLSKSMAEFEALFKEIWNRES